MYLKNPHVHDGLVTFVADDDVFLAPLEGGWATRLSAERAGASDPHFAPDGQHIAWASPRDGHPEVIVASLASGEVRRLTWLASTMLRVLGWADAETILIATTFGATEMREQNVHAVQLTGEVTRLDIGPAGGLAVHPSGARVLSSVNSRGPQMWKRYRGGTAAKLWFDRNGDGTWERLLPEEVAGMVDPCWVGDTLCFVSDRGDTWPGAGTDQANIWALDVLAGETEPRRITHHDVSQGYVCNATSDGKVLVYDCHGELFIVPEIDAAPERIDVQFAFPVEPTEELDPTARLESVIPVGAGHASLVTTRGRTFHLPHREGPGRALVAESGVRAQFAQPLGTEGSVVMITDAGGDDGILVVTAEGPQETYATGELGTVLHLQAAPDGRHVATISHDGWIRLHDVVDRSTVDVHRSEQGEATGLCFSPDSRHLAWCQPTAGEAIYNQIMMCVVVAETASAEVHQLTDGRFNDTEPTFTADGQHVAFLSNRTFEPVYDAHSFDLNFASSVRPWLAPLRAVDPAPFGPAVDGRLPAPVDAPKPDPVESIDSRGFEQRIVPFPVPSGEYRNLRATAKGLLWIHEKSDRGTLQARVAGADVEEYDVLEHFTFANRKLDVLADRVDAVEVSQDHERLVMIADKEVTARPASRKVEKDDPEFTTVDMSRICFEIELRAEWRQMFDENARIMARHFWREDMDGVDWGAVCARYRPLVDKATRVNDVVDILWETVGELNTSHAYVMRQPVADQHQPGLLGADLSPDPQGWRIDRILASETSDPKARSPLMAAGVAAQEGDLIVAVNGHPCTPPKPPMFWLRGLAEKPVELTLQRAEEQRRVVVVPVASEDDLRYHDWVASRRARVDELSGGRLGYLHVPDMQARGWAQLHRDLERATAKEGVVLDVRYNRGGHTSQLVLERLARRPIA